MSDPETEAALEVVLQKSGNVTAFLDNVFGFLANRTDFFLECPPEGASFGFPKGHAESIVRSKFMEWSGNVASRSKAIGSSKTSLAPATSSQEKKKDPVPTKPKGSSVASAKESSLKSRNAEDNYNGRTTDKYSWSQTINEVDVKVPVSSEIKKGKQLNVTITNTDLKIQMQGVQDVLVCGKFSFPVKKDDCYWNLVPGEAIRIWLQKSQERWWQALLEGEEPLDMSKIEAVRPMEELSEEEQMKIQELSWNEEQKRLGLPTSEQLKMQKTLQAAWNAEGSPFQGQPFDPSQVQVHAGTDGTFTPFGSNGASS